ncbi:DUF6527 family protein [Christiangramia forsetii]|uniref:Uncharacterized protein n=2 Tax=Christiangramia forsetii TaxID=411153 RepID=A0M1S1_CHRFK|nr:DUF6527 family protein [Christiangramia forsetii]GGG45518.1 hypothetical protein GCM10011532_31870 [Christiangramia forsetii]CAL66566.1 conserved hypothetical protein [Christiangramia forsetii KT0803]
MGKIKLLKVEYLPKDLEQGILYVSEEFGIAGHLCPCGCDNKIMTPLDPSEWSFKEITNKPTLYPSIGNWQLPCRSHYWITNGNIEWSYDWSEEEIIAGREAEARKRKAYYDDLEAKQTKKSIFRRISNWFLKLILNIKN